MDNISSSLGFGGSSSDPKTAVMNQVRQEAALQNARQLIEVGYSMLIFGSQFTDFICPEIERALLREVRPSARLFSLKRRTNLLHAVHGEVHGCMEYSQQAIHLENTTGEWKELG